MAKTGKSFFSTTGGLITGAAGVLSAVVGAAGLAIQQGWVGGSDDGASTVEAGGTGASGRAPAGRGGRATAAVVPTFSVEPKNVSFLPLGDRQEKVKVTNTGVVELDLKSPSVTGEDADRFSVDEGTCNAPLDPGRSCDLEVTFDPATGSFTALLVVEAGGGARAAEVPLKGTSAAL